MPEYKTDPGVLCMAPCCEVGVGFPARLCTYISINWWDVYAETVLICRGMCLHGHPLSRVRLHRCASEEHRRLPHLYGNRPTTAFRQTHLSHRDRRPAKTQ